MERIAKTLVLLAASSFLRIAFAQSASSTSADIEQAIRGNDLARLRLLVRTKESANLPNRLQWTPLHYAAIYGSPDAVAYLLEAGSDPNGRSQQGDTPLIYGAWNFEITKILIEHGADVNAAGNGGETALTIASNSSNNFATVRFLVEHRANVNAQNAFGLNALSNAARSGDAPSMEYLISKGAPFAIARSGQGALNWGIPHLLPNQVTDLIARGNDPNRSNTFGGMVKNGPIQLVHLTPLMLAAPHSSLPVIDSLLKGGARVNDVDIRKMNPLMFSIATDHAHPEIVQKLVSAGSDINSKDMYGATPMEWAVRFGNPEVVEILTKAGAPRISLTETPRPLAGTEAKTAAEAIERSTGLFTKTGPMFFKEGGGCNGCHNQPLYGNVYGSLRREGIAVQPSLRQGFLDASTATRPMLLSELPLLEGPPGDLDSLLYPMMTMAELGEERTALTDAIVHYVATRQDASGGWIQNGLARPPLEDSNIMRTSFAIHALARYGWAARNSEFAQRIGRARLWLAAAKPDTTYEAAERIAGLRAAGETPEELKRDVNALLALQRPDGGWAQTKFLEPDAYATGLVLHRLYSHGLMEPNDEHYRRGVAFLMRTQFPDGSWYVRSRSPKFQPYFQSGFPFEHDQWISSAGSALAVMALAPASRNTNSMRTSAKLIAH